MKDVTSYLDEIGVSYKQYGEHHHVREGWLGLDCPFCGPNSGRYHLGLNLRTFYLHCWRCGRTSPSETLDAMGIVPSRFYSFHERLPTSEASKSLGTKASDGAIGRLKEPLGRGPLGRVHRTYLRARGFRPSELEELWRLEGIALAARLAWRIYVPITLSGRRVSWTTRAVGERVEQRYISAAPDQEVVPHKHVLYGLDMCAHSVVIVEGPTDVWNVGPGSAAVFGTDYTIWQVKALSTVPNRYICFDSESEAQSKAKELARTLSCFPGKTEVIVLDAADPGSASRKEIRLLRKATGLGQG